MMNKERLKKKHTKWTNSEPNKRECTNSLDLSTKSHNNKCRSNMINNIRTPKWTIILTNHHRKNSTTNNKCMSNSNKTISMISNSNNSNNNSNKICHSMNSRLSTTSMRLLSRERWRSWKDSRKRPRERRSLSKQRVKNKIWWHRKVRWELMLYLLFKVVRGSFKWCLISCSKRRRKYSRIKWT